MKRKIRKRSAQLAIAVALLTAAGFQNQAAAAGKAKTAATTTKTVKKKKVLPRVSRWVVYRGGYYWFNCQGIMQKDVIRLIHGKFYCFDETGRARIGFIRKGGHIYFANRRGQFLTGWRTINHKRFYFSARGRAAQGLREIGGKTYYFSWRGERLSGWRIVDGRKYYFDPKDGQMVRGQTVDGLLIDESGVAPFTTSELLSGKCREILSEITNDSMSQQEKIRACYDYMVSGGGFGYTTWRDFSYYDGWSVDYAYEMLSMRSGNCYNFASAFAYLVKQAGCDVTIVRGRVPGRRDGAADGFTRHCWTIVNGLYYDTELAYAGSAYIYADQNFPWSYQVTGNEQL